MPEELEAIWSLPRRGCLVETPGGFWPAAQSEALARTRRVEHRIEADSLYDAACFLLALTDNAYRTEEPYRGPILLGFRGQHAKYLTLLPSTCRKGREDRILDGLSCGWLRVALQYQHDKHYHYAAPLQLGEKVLERRYCFGPDETSTVAQHYGLGTRLIDWTWDPLVALIFAVRGLGEGDFGTVLITRVDPRGHTEIVLPPPMAQRVWIQRGFFQELCCPDDRGLIQLMPHLIRSPTASTIDAFERIVFRCSAKDVLFAEERYSLLLLESDPIVPLKEWSTQSATLHGQPRSWYSGRLDKIPAELGLQDLPFEAIQEDIRLMSDYIDCVALRNHNGKYGYDLYAMEYLNQRTGMDATIRDEGAAKALDPKAGHLAMLLNNATLIRGSQLGPAPYSCD